MRFILGARTPRLISILMSFMGCNWKGLLSILEIFAAGPVLPCLPAGSRQKRYLAIWTSDGAANRSRAIVIAVSWDLTWGSVVAEETSFIFDPYGLSSGGLEFFGQRKSFSGMASDSGEYRFGPALAIGAVIARFAKLRAIEVTPQAMNLLIAMTLELTVSQNVGTAANPRKADNSRFVAGMRQLVSYLEYMSARLRGAPASYKVTDFDIAWLDGILSIDGQGDLIYISDTFGTVISNPSIGSFGMGYPKEITALLAVAWMPDFVRNIKCSCWPV